MSPQSEERREVCKRCERNIDSVWAAFGYGDYVLSCPGKGATGAMHAPSIPTESREERLEKALAKLVDDATAVMNEYRSHFSDEDPQVKTGYARLIGATRVSNLIFAASAALERKA